MREAAQCTVRPPDDGSGWPQGPRLPFKRRCIHLHFGAQKSTRGLTGLKLRGRQAGSFWGSQGKIHFCLFQLPETSCIPRLSRSLPPSSKAAKVSGVFVASHPSGCPPPASLYKQPVIIGPSRTTQALLALLSSAMLRNLLSPLPHKETHSQAQELGNRRPLFLRPQEETPRDIW